MKFLRNTHTEDGEPRPELKEMSAFEDAVWEAHGDIVHMVNTKKPMDFEEILQAIRDDVVNFQYCPTDLKRFAVEVGTLPTFGDVALAIVRCIEAGFIRVTP